MKLTLQYGRAHPFALRLGQLFFIFFLTMTLITTLQAREQETQHYALTIQGSITSTNFLDNVSESIPVEIRATLSTTMQVDSAQEGQEGHLFIDELHIRSDEGLVSIPVRSEGYQFIFDEHGIPQLVETASDLKTLGFDLNEVLPLLFPTIPADGLEEETTWETHHDQLITENESDAPWYLALHNTYNVTEIRNDGTAVVQNTIRGSDTKSLEPGRLRADQIGSGVLHIDTAEGHMKSSATTILYTLEQMRPAGSSQPEENIEIRTLITTSLEHLPERTAADDAAAGFLYADPARRYTVTLSDDWSTPPFLQDRTSSIFTSRDQQSQLHIDISHASEQHDLMEQAQAMVQHYTRYLIDFSLITEPTEQTLGDETVVWVEYSYYDEHDIVEGSILMRRDDHDVVIQLATTPTTYNAHSVDTLHTIAQNFELGTNPMGSVTADNLHMAPFITYESEQFAFEIEVPSLWPPLQTADENAAVFAELGENGYISIHLESVAMEDSATELLQQWVRQLQNEMPSLEIIDEVATTGLGPLSGATTTLRIVEDETTWQRKITAANWHGILYVATIDYKADGFADRNAIFERILASFRPLPEQALKQTRTFHAQNPPPSPGSADSLLLIGRIFHKQFDEDDAQRHAGDEVRLEFSINNETYTAFTDSDGFFYLADVPKPLDGEIHVNTIRGNLFQLPFEVDIPLRGLSVRSLGRISLFGELTLVLQEDKSTVDIQLDSGADTTTGKSTVHESFLSRYPDSPWAEMVRDDFEQRTANN